jgi:phosphate/sulfate permease
VDRFFRRLQLVSRGIYSLGHGGNDAQKNDGHHRAAADTCRPRELGRVAHKMLWHEHTVALW